MPLFIHVLGPNRHKKRAHEGKFTPDDFDKEKFQEYCEEREAQFAAEERDKKAAARKASKVLRGEEDEEENESQEDFEEPKKSPLKVNLGRQVSFNSCQHSSHISCQLSLSLVSGSTRRKNSRSRNQSYPTMRMRTRKSLNHLPKSRLQEGRTGVVGRLSQLIHSLKTSQRSKSCHNSCQNSCHNSCLV